MAFWFKPKEVKEKLILKTFQVLKAEREQLEAKQDRVVQIGFQIMQLTMANPKDSRIKGLKAEQAALLKETKKLPDVDSKIKQLAQKFVAIEST